MTRQGLSGTRAHTFTSVVAPQVGDELIADAAELFAHLRDERTRVALLKILAPETQAPKIRQIRLFAKLVAKYRECFGDLDRYIQNYCSDNESRSAAQNGLLFELEVFELLDSLPEVTIKAIGYALPGAVIDFLIEIDGVAWLLEVKKSLPVFPYGQFPAKAQANHTLKQVRLMGRSHYFSAIMVRSIANTNDHARYILQRNRVTLLDYGIVKKRRRLFGPIDAQ